ncbi:NUDIX domain-containing protein [Paracoccus contaminans]|nr:NUDIX domain-containing protein [Paracoccus contaminans]
MSDDGIVLLAGMLAEPAVMKALGLNAAGAAADDGTGLGAQSCSPSLKGGAPGGCGPLVPVLPNQALRRYAEVMELVPVPGPHGPVLGLNPSGAPSPPHDAADPALAAAIARAIAASTQPVALIRKRLPLIAGWVASQRRAEDERGLPLPPGPADPDRLRIEERREPYAAYFSVHELRLRHRLHRGGWSAPVERAVFVSGDAVVVLPWDPVRDRVLLVDQLRAGPAARGDAQPWVHEPIAGRIDAGESPETTARREAEEEAGITLGRLIPVPAHYPSPGIMAEYVYSFVGIADLPDGIATVSGLDSEGEDIRGTLLAREELTRMTLDGRIVSGPLMILALWLDRMAPRLQAGKG